MDSASSEEASGASGRGPPALVAAVGHDRAGALAIMQQSVVPDQVTETLVTGTALSCPLTAPQLPHVRPSGELLHEQ